jgi:oligopeptide/dipeptide ABC transporter ATP-binding protein
MTESKLLSVEGLRVAIDGEGRTIHAVDGIDFEIGRRVSVGLVGESGCGKSLTALALLGLLPKPAVRIDAGRIVFDGVDLAALRERELRSYRGKRIAMIFQEPMTSLNPVYSNGEQIAEALRLHEGLSRREAAERSVELLDRVRIADPSRRAKEYPHQLSGGMRQRVMIAIAISCSPQLLIADEPTTALDVTVQAEILELLESLRASMGMSLLHISHDLAVLARSSQQIMVMYAGKIVESAPADRLFETPAHPYTLGLLACRPELGVKRLRLPVIGGSVPEPGDRPSGCAFADRCPFVLERCRVEEPPLRMIEGGHDVQCFEAERVREMKRWPVDA